mmetsp:Transcript_68815/g.222383  ORF Transcript_68815/g.222383 Transcript_68815/m.222383 type:complete len:267 (+) Transcript_68815:93-893(+)
MAQLGRGGPQDADSFYVQDCRQVQNNTHSIQTLTGQISRLVGTLESEKDFQHCRGMVDDAVRQASETRSVLARIREHQHQATNPAERNNRRMMYQKLGDNLAITVRVLEDVVRRFTAEERRRPALCSSEGAGLNMATLRAPTAVAAGDAAGGNEQQLLSVDEGSCRSSLDEEIEQDRCRTLRRVDEDVLCLQRIYTDLANTAEEQQASFDTIESHMASAAADLERGRNEIELTGKYGWGRRLKRKMWMTLGGALAAVAVTSFIFSS